MRPSFVFSVDVEGLWGVFFVERWRGDAAAARGAREAVPAMLRLLDERRLPATFAVVGHLFLDRCERGDGRPHPEMPRASYPWWPGDWYAHDPCSDEASAPDWYGRSLVEAIRRSPGGHELASHGFSHAVFDERHMDAAVAAAEFSAARRAAAGAGVEVRSFVYPQNVVGHGPLLAPAGFTCFRAPDGDEPQRAGPPGGAGRAIRFARHVAGAAPPVGRPRLVHGVVEIPSSMPIVGAEGIRVLISRRARVARARRGLEAARREGAVFHLWTHPHAFAGRGAGVLDSLAATLDDAAALRDRGEIEVATMGSMAAGFLAGAGR
ncbi:MAG: polysaccharide deacetylase family protein [Planctomycetes bacterium]|nr:polysaccharide deacetylase family protein [Planctomycetota bacterium]